MSEEKTPAQVRADMSRTLLLQMAQAPDATTRDNANIALAAQGLNSQGQPINAAPAPAAAPAAAPVAAPAPAAPILNQPRPAATPAPGPSDASLEGLRDANGLLLGKFRTVDELRRSYFGGQNLISQLSDDNIRLKNQSVTATPSPTTLPGSAPGDAPRVNPTARSYDQEIAELVKSSEESGQIDPQALLQTVSRIAARAGQEAVQNELRPMQAMSEAETYMRSKYPESVNHAQELGNFVKTDPVAGPTVQALMASGQYKAAFEYAWSMYTVQNGLSVERGIAVNSQIAEEERLRARAAAGFSGSPNTGVHADVQKANEPLTADQIAALNEHSKSDQGVLRRRVMLGSFLPPEWRTWEGQRQ